MNAQAAAALERAQRIRIARAATRRELATLGRGFPARQRCAELLESPPAHLATIRVTDLIAYCHGMGPTNAEWIVRRHRIGLMRVVGQLTDRQRQAIAADLRGELQQIELGGAGGRAA